MNTIWKLKKKRKSEIKRRKVNIRTKSDMVQAVRHPQSLAKK